MDFKDYIDELNDLDKKEAKTKLGTFYTLNSATFKFFKAIDLTIQELLNQPNVDTSAKKQLEDILPLLVGLRPVILNLDSITYATGYKKKIEKTVSYIKTQMSVNEVSSNAQNFFSLLESNKDALKAEKANEQDRNAREQATIAEETRKRREREAAENRKQFQISFEYNKSAMAVGGPIQMFLDDVYLDNFSQTNIF